MKAYLIKPLSQIHIGYALADREGTELFPRSDTLAAAIAICWSQIFEETPEEIFRNPPFRVSSAMPWVKTDDEIRLFLPMRKDVDFKEIEDSLKLRAKVLKKIKWVEDSYWHKMFESKKFPLADEDKDELLRKKEQVESEGKSARSEIERFFKEKFLAGNMLVKKVRRGKYFAVETNQRVTVNRLSPVSETFFFNEAYFSDKAGFWILADFDDNSAENKFRAALELLGDTGIGADRNYGKGLFKIEKILSDDQIGLPRKDDADKTLLLSLWAPTLDEKDAVLNDSSCWELLMRGGWIAPGRGVSAMRKPIWMFAEGSVIAGNVKGHAPDVTPPGLEVKVGHKVYRWGYALGVKIR